MSEENCFYVLSYTVRGVESITTTSRKFNNLGALFTFLVGEFDIIHCDSNYFEDFKIEKICIDSDYDHNIPIFKIPRLF